MVGVSAKRQPIHPVLKNLKPETTSRLKPAASNKSGER
jgi:hypothetical protein